MAASCRAYWNVDALSGRKQSGRPPAASAAHQGFERAASGSAITVR